MTGLATDISQLDYSAFGPRDLANIVLQRSEVIEDVPRPNRVIRAWIAGDEAPLMELVERFGVVLAQRAAHHIQREFEALTPVLDHIGPGRIADIGCGYAIFDLFAHHRYGAHLLLIDIEKTEHRHFGYEAEAAAYTSLATARAFLAANGVPQAKITLWNPESDDDIEAPQQVDLAISLLSCGYHYPVDMYLPFFRYGVAPEGSVILDMRNHAVEESRKTLGLLGGMTELSHGRKHKRVHLRKGRA